MTKCLIKILSLRLLKGLISLIDFGECDIFSAVSVDRFLSEIVISKSHFFSTYLLKEIPTARIQSLST